MTSKEMPRERLLFVGRRNLSIQELICVILSVGNRKKTVFQLAQEVEDALKRTDTADAETLLGSVSDLGNAQTARLLAAMELGRRLSCQWLEEKSLKLSNPKDAADYLLPTMSGLTEEHFYVVLVNIKNRPLSIHRVAQGSREAVFFPIRDVFTEAIRWKASGILCVHNHPSGDPTPSREDYDLTEKIKASANLLGIRFLDHLVYSDTRVFSIESKSSIFL